MGLLNDNHATASTVQLYRSALKFLYTSTLKRPWFDLEIAGIKKRLLPTVLSVEEIVENRALKHGLLGMNFRWPGFGFTAKPHI